MTDKENTENIRSQKALLRKKTIEKRRNLPASDRRLKSRQICESFLAGPEYDASRTILLYRAYNGEVDTDLIFERAIADGKTVAYPVSNFTDGTPELVFYVVNDTDKFRAGFKGIPEPDTAGGCVAFEGDADICITPGVVFDSKCNRIGYGKAFYDTYLRQNSPGTVIGLAYDIQITDDFETEDCDRPADMVITESKVYRR